MRWVFLAKDIIYISLGPHSDILMTGGGGGGGKGNNRSSYFIPQKSQLRNLSIEKNP